MAADSFFSDEEVAQMTKGLEQNAAKIRFLRRLGLRVDKRPDGTPLAWRPAPAGQEEATGQNASVNAGSVVVGLQQWAARKQRGQKAQGR